MARTLALLKGELPRDLAQLTYSYFASGSLDIYHLAKNGEWEAAFHGAPNRLMYGACFSGYIELMQYAITKGANDFSSGLWYACRGGRIEMARLMIDMSASNWNDGLSAACSGHIELVRFMIDKGANDWNNGIGVACCHGCNEIVQLMIDKGATTCFNCWKTMDAHLAIAKK
jgi:hypothetical protein